MLRKVILFAFLSFMGIGSAHAITLFMPAASGIPDQTHEGFPGGINMNGCLVDASTGKMLIQVDMVLPNSIPDCVMAFPINLPVGSIITGVQIAYRDDSGNLMRSITALLAVDRMRPNMGSIAVGGANDLMVPHFQDLVMNMGPLSVQTSTGDVYWVRVSTHNITEVDYVAVTYN